MKKIIVLTCLFCLLTLLPKMLLAEDTRTIRISCTIPAIPGVNAPPFVEREERVKTNEDDQQKSSGKIVVAEEKRQTPEEEKVIFVAPIFIVEEETKDFELSGGETTQVALKTIYSR